MDRRLLALAVLAPVAFLAAGPFPPAAPIAGIALAAAAVGAALHGGWRGWGLAVGPGALAVAAAAPGSLVSYGASALAGPLVADSLRRGRSPGWATVWGALPAVALTVAVAVSGFQPIPEDFGTSLEAVFGEAARRGDLPVERVAELRETSEKALEIARRTWVASETIWIWASVALGLAVARRITGRGGAGFGPFARFDLPDGVVWVFIVGLAAVLVGRGGALGAAGTNLVVVTGFAFGLRGFAIERFWMDRAGLGPAARFGLFAGGAILFLPVFLILATGLGLFDTWFDFRRQREPEPGSPLSPFLRRSSGDDANEKE